MATSHSSSSSRSFRSGPCSWIPASAKPQDGNVYSLVATIEARSTLNRHVASQCSVATVPLSQAESLIPIDHCSSSPDTLKLLSIAHFRTSRYRWVDSGLIVGYNHGFKSTSTGSPAWSTTPSTAPAAAANSAAAATRPESRRSTKLEPDRN